MRKTQTFRISTTTCNNAQDHKKTIVMIPYLDPETEEHFADYERFEMAIERAVVKLYGRNTFLQINQGLSNTDETKYGQIFCPLPGQNNCNTSVTYQIRVDIETS